MAKTMHTYLDGISVQFYRGIGEETQYVAPFSRMNIFIGANNAGKSIILEAFANHLPSILSERSLKALVGPDIHDGTKKGDFSMSIARSNASVENEILGAFEEKNPNFEINQRSRGIIWNVQTEIDNIIAKISRSGHIWISPHAGKKFMIDNPLEYAETVEATERWHELWTLLTGQGGGSRDQHWIPDVLKKIVDASRPALPKIHLIPAKRNIGPKGAALKDLSGEGLIDHLATLQNPSWNKQIDREKFSRINNFLRTVTGKSDASLEVPNQREHLLVHMDNKVLPLSSLGTGIHEVILMASFCTIHDKSIMCIEEPEIHLNPLLQRKLVKYLLEETSSQYFIATHSPAFLDTFGAHIFHVSNDGEQTYVKPAITHQDQCKILDDLGAQASDILQANAVIWVEGPSDRIYLKHWLTSIDQNIQEGIHYSIMFYGGALIRHLSASEEALDEFIKLRDLNRNMAILIDSDKCSPDAPLKKHAERIKDEMDGGPGIAWITEGREVENYIEGSRLQSALKKCHPNIYIAPGKTGKYENSFYFFRDNPNKLGTKMTYKNADKVGAAMQVCKEAANLDIFDLRSRVQEIVNMIHKANNYN